MKQTAVSIAVESVKKYEQTPYFCPACGKQELWAELSDDGPHSGLYGCSACHECMSMNVWVQNDAVPTQRLSVATKKAA